MYVVHCDFWAKIDFKKSKRSYEYAWYNYTVILGFVMHYFLLPFLESEALLTDDQLSSVAYGQFPTSGVWNASTISSIRSTWWNGYEPAGEDCCLYDIVVINECGSLYSTHTAIQTSIIIMVKH